jgi:hypothetical protein
MWNYIGFPDDWEGWVLARTTVGTCTAWEVFTPVFAFPDSGSSTQAIVTDLVDNDQSLQYRVMIATSSGEYIAPPENIFFYDSTFLAFVTCGVAPITRATISDIGWGWWVYVCPGRCWAGATYIDNLPPEYQGYADTGQVLDFYGSVLCGMIEGCSLTVTHAEPVPGCSDPVSVQSSTWTAVKARFR